MNKMYLHASESGVDGGGVVLCLLVEEADVGHGGAGAVNTIMYSHTTALSRFCHFNANTEQETFNLIN